MSETIKWLLGFIVAVAAAFICYQQLVIAKRGEDRSLATPNYFQRRDEIQPINSSASNPTTSTASPRVSPKPDATNEIANQQKPDSPPIKLVISPKLDVESECDSGKWSSCAEAAKLHEGSAQDALVGEALAKKGCEGNDPKSCREAGIILIKWAPSSSYDESVRAKVFAYLQAGCDGNDLESCYQKGKFEYYGPDPAYLPEAVKDFAKACKANHGAACLELGFMYENGRGVPKDITTARSYWDKSCELDKESRGCGLSKFYAPHL